LAILASIPLYLIYSCSGCTEIAPENHRIEPRRSAADAFIDYYHLKKYFPSRTRSSMDRALRLRSGQASDFELERDGEHPFHGGKYCPFSLWSWQQSVHPEHKFHPFHANCTQTAPKHKTTGLATRSITKTPDMKMSRGVFVIDVYIWI